METSTNTGPPPPSTGPLRLRDGRPLEVTARLQLFWALVLATVLIMQASLPFRLAGAVPCLLAIWVAVTVLARLARARRIGVRLGRAWPVGIGLGLCLVMLLLLGVTAAFYPIYADSEACLAGANTKAAHAQCMQDSENRLNTWRTQMLTRLK